MSKATLLSRVVSRKTVALIIRFDFFFALVNINSYGYLPGGLSLATMSEYIRLLSLAFGLIMSNCRKKSWTNFQRNKEKMKWKKESNKLFEDINFYQFMFGKKWKESRLLSFYPIFLKIHFTPIYLRRIENSLIVCTDIEVKKFGKNMYM